MIFRLPNVYCQLVEMNRFTKKTFGVRPHSILLALMENLEIWSVTSWTETLYQLISKVKMIKYSQCCQLFITNLPNKFWRSLYFQDISIIICAIFFLQILRIKVGNTDSESLFIKIFLFSRSRWSHCFAQCLLSGNK